MKLTSKGIHLDICSDATIEAPVWQRLYGLKSTPDIGGEKEKLDVTDFDCDNKEYVDGIGDYGTLEFGFWLNKEESADTANATKLLQSYDALRKLELDGSTPTFRLVYPSGFGFQWEGSVNTKIVGAEVNAPLEFKLSTALQSDMKDITVVEGK